MTTSIEAIQKYLAEVKAVRVAYRGLDSSDRQTDWAFIVAAPVTQEKLERALAIAVGALDDSEIEIDDRVRNKALADIARAIGEG